MSRVPSGDPIDYLVRRQYPDAAMWEDWERRRKEQAEAVAKDIANLAFIGGETNRRISKTKFESYITGFVDVIGSEAFAAQSIPLDAELCGIDAYKRFLAARRVAIADRLNQFLGTTEPTRASDSRENPYLPRGSGHRGAGLLSRRLQGREAGDTPGSLGVACLHSFSVARAYDVQ